MSFGFRDCSLEGNCKDKADSSRGDGPALGKENALIQDAISGDNAFGTVLSVM